MTRGKGPFVECIVCGNRAKHRVGMDNTPLCGTHKNQLRRNAGFGMFGYLTHLTRSDIRRAFGFLVVNDQKEGGKS